ncbi:hypothetical protein ACIRRH_22625 [Kitasatospora sp. NPDC101235]|uniref:hypothetical protein n=1 Tax=Kitasatospora sp. NPDC101235 TaxID=3364101 RepID=UPI0037F2C0AB
MNITTTLHSWDESVALFERRGLPVSSYENLYEEEYDVHSGALSVEGHLDLDAAQPEGTGYIVDDDPDDVRGFDAPGVHGGRLLRRIEAGLPVTLAAGRA